MTTTAPEQHPMTPGSPGHGPCAREAGSLGRTRLPDLASAALGGTVVYASDELFADARNCIPTRATSTRSRPPTGWPPTSGSPSIQTAG